MYIHNYCVSPTAIVLLTELSAVWTLTLVPQFNLNQYNFQCNSYLAVIPINIQSTLIIPFVFYSTRSSSTQLCRLLDNLGSRRQPRARAICLSSEQTLVFVKSVRALNFNQHQTERSNRLEADLVCAEPVCTLIKKF